MSRFVALVLSVCSLAFVTGCTRGVSSSDTSTRPVTGNGTAVVRFVQGSPDSGTSGSTLVDFKIDGTLAFSAIQYGTITLYYSVLAQAHTIEADVSGTSTVVLPNTSLNAVSGGIYTFVLAGKKANSSQQWVSFSEPVFTNTASQSVLNVHHASPFANANGAPTLNFGFNAYKQTNYQTAASVTFPGSTMGTGTNYLMPTSAASAPGVQIYAIPSTQVPSAANPPAVTILPSEVDGNNPGNLLPAAAGDYHFDIFAIDGPTTSTSATNPGIELVGIFS